MPSIQFIVCDVLRDLVPCAQFEKREKLLGRVLLLVKLQAEACDFTKSNTAPWMFFLFFKLNRWYQVTQSIIFSMTFLSF